MIPNQNLLLKECKVKQFHWTYPCRGYVLWDFSLQQNTEYWSKLIASYSTNSAQSTLLHFLNSLLYLNILVFITRCHCLSTENILMNDWKWLRLPPPAAFSSFSIEEVSLSPLSPPHLGGMLVFALVNWNILKTVGERNNKDRELPFVPASWQFWIKQVYSAGFQNNIAGYSFFLSAVCRWWDWLYFNLFSLGAKTKTKLRTCMKKEWHNVYFLDFDLLTLS